MHSHPSLRGRPAPRCPADALGAPRLGLRGAVHAAYVGAVLFISLWPRSYVDAYVGVSVQHREMWIHVFCFVGLAVVSLWAYGHRTAVWRNRLTCWTFCALFGALLEVLQAAIPGVNRSCSTHDMRGNAVGAALGAVLVPIGLWPRRREEGHGEP